MFPAGAGRVEDVKAEERSAVAVAVNPAADNFRKVRLVCVFDTGAPGMNRFVVSIVREYRSNGGQFHGGIDGIQIAAPCFLQNDSAGWLMGYRWTCGGTGSAVRDIGLENCLERRVQRP